MSTKFTDEEVDILIEFLNDEIGELKDGDTLENYYDKAADLSQAISQLHYKNEIEHPSIREKVKAVMERITEQWIEGANVSFGRRNEDLSNTAWDNKPELLSDVKSECEEAAEYLGILIKLEQWEKESE